MDYDQALVPAGLTNVVGDLGLRLAQPGLAGRRNGARLGPKRWRPRRGSAGADQRGGHFRRRCPQSSAEGRRNGVRLGYNTFGQTNVPASATNVVAIAAGGWHSLALKANGTIVAWGDNGYVPFGSTTTNQTASGQATVPPNLTNAVVVGIAPVAGKVWRWWAARHPVTQFC